MTSAPNPLSEKRTRLADYLDSLETSACNVLFCEQFDEKSKIWNYERHAHDFIELIYFLEGKAEIVDSDQTMATSLLELVIYPAGTFHQEYLDTRYHQAIICLQLACPASLEYPHLFKLKDRQGILRWIIRRIHAEFRASGDLQATIVQDLVKLLFDYMSQLARIHETPSFSIPDQCLLFIQEHFAEPIDSDRLAREIHVSHSYLNRVFRQQYGMTPIQYLHKFRIEVAREMLVQTDSKIVEIARYAGYDDVKHFSKLFKQLTRTSPAAYREEFSVRR